MARRHVSRRRLLVWVPGALAAVAVSGCGFFRPPRPPHVKPLPERPDIRAPVKQVPWDQLQPSYDNRPTRQPRR